MRFKSTAAAVAAAFTAFAGRPAHALTTAQAQAYLLQANPTCAVSAFPPIAGHVQGASMEVSVLKYTVEGCQGGNNHFTTLAVLYDAGSGRVAAYDNRSLPAEDVESVAVRDGRILIATLVYGPSDPRCCPSRKASYVVVVSQGKLVVAR